MKLAMNIFGRRLRQLRESRGLSIRRLAKLSGIDPSQIYRYESGEYSPTESVIRILAKTLNSSADYLLGLTDDPRPRDSEISIYEFIPNVHKTAPEKLRKIAQQLLQLANELEKSFGE